MVKRYTQPVVQTTPEPGFHVKEVPLFEDVKGKYVLASDYALLVTEHERTEAELKSMTRQKDEWHGRASESVRLRRERDEARAALREIRDKYPPGEFRGLADECAIWHLANNALGSELETFGVKT